MQLKSSPLTFVILLISLLLRASTGYAQFEFPNSLGGLGAMSNAKQPVSIKAEFTAAQDDRPPLLFVTANIGEHFHVYAIDQGELPDGGGGPMPTELSISSEDIKISGDWNAIPAPKTHIDEEIWTGLEIREHDTEVTWVVALNLPPDADPATLEIKGLVAGQACDPHSCVPFDKPFKAKLGKGIPLPEGFQPWAEKKPAPSTQSGTPGSPSSTDAAAATQASDTAQLNSKDESIAAGELAPATEPALAAEGTIPDSFLTLLGLGFLGGVILNVMPCVLPVIGLKVFAFIEQAGQSRWKIFALNLWYSLGVISVFMVLAVLSIVFRLGWGQLFQYPEFNIAMAAVVFAMGLSFLGIWEIPIPGFIGTSSVTDIGKKEGYEGAFAKGTITTLLATPCTGPFMGTALVGVLNRPPHQILAIFFSIGLGMSSPYLLIGAFPQMTRFLPKPGEWMNTFKQLMGFVLIGTVVYLLTLLRSYYVVPTVAFLFGIWLACWWIGRVPVTAESNKRWNALGEGIAVGTAIGLLAFYWLSPILEYRQQRDAERLAEARLEELLATGGGTYKVSNEPWQVYSERKLQWLLDQGKTVVIDFTADWCPTCKLMEKTVLKTEDMAKVFAENDIYTLVADWTHQDNSSEVSKKLAELNAAQIPLLAIYSPRNREMPKLIPGTYTISGLTQELLELGSTASVASSSSAALAIQQ